VADLDFRVISMQYLSNFTQKTATRVLVILTAFWLIGFSAFAQDAAPAESSAPVADQATLDLGKSLFENNCTSCHGVGSEDVVGPGLKGIMQRRNMDWLIKWVKSSQTVINSGDKYAVDLYNKYNKTQMQNFNLKDDEIKAIFAYVQVESEKAPAVVATASTGDSTGAATPSSDGGVSQTYLLIVLFSLVIILAAILMLLNSIASSLRDFIKVKKDTIEEDEADILEQGTVVGDILKTKFYNQTWFKAIATVVFVLVLSYQGVQYLFGIGVQKGYAPTQPIAFSHKIHAGDNKIDCQYCHSTASLSKNASIPAANICMNCHSVIKKDSPEIQKIYKAVEQNKPIEWIRIHNLPDLAYFNHSQHVAVGQVECQTCHGQIQEMDVVGQHADLTMGWCISCHRETVVKSEGNAYYDKLMEYHKTTKDLKEMKVVNIGGLECSKCHY
jgi:mono/diheme cytochrome c family protein